MNVNSIFDSFLLASDKVHTISEINRITKEIISEKNTCGSCCYWMTSKCPREIGKHKVSCNERSCNSFIIDPISLKTIQEKEKQIQELKTKL